jgi:hypothetical protein
VTCLETRTTHQFFPIFCNNSFSIFAAARFVIAFGTDIGGLGASALSQGDDDCSKCPGARSEMLYCPGGPIGLVVATTAHLNCSVGFYDTTCGDQAKRKKSH